MIDINNFDAISIGLASSQADPKLVLRRGHQAGDDQLPNPQAREGRALLRAHLRSHQGLGVLLRQVQARPLQGHRLRALRRRGHAFQGAPRAHGARGPGRAGLAHLVLQGRAVAHRLPARHGAQGAGEGPVLRGLDRHLDRRGGAREGHAQAGEGGPEGPRLLRRREGGARPGAARVARPAPRVPPDGQAVRLLGGRPALVRDARRQPEEDQRRRAREAREGHSQGLRLRHPGHRGLHRGRGRAHAAGLGPVPRHEAKGRHRRRDRLP